MSFFKNFFGIKNKIENITDEASEQDSSTFQYQPHGWGTVEEILGGSNTLSGENITASNAFNRITTVFACVDRRATALAKLPFGVYVKNGETRRPASEHNLNYLLTKRPNSYQTPMMYKKYIVTCQLLWGYAVILKKFDSTGMITELVPLKPQEVGIHKIIGEDRYLYTYNGSTYTEDELIYIPYITLDGKRGKAPMSVARESAGAVQAMTKHLNKFYKNGALRQAALTTSSILSPAAKMKMKSEWIKLNGGYENTGAPAILDNGLDYKDISMPLKDAEFIESKRLTAQEIASVFNVPPSTIGLASEKYSNLQEINDRYMQDVVQPDCINIEEAHNFSCFLENEKDYYTKFNISAGMRGSDEKRAAFYKEMLNIGVFSVNDILALEDRNSIGDIGDKHYFSLNYTTLDTLEKHIRIQNNKNGVDED